MNETKIIAMPAIATHIPSRAQRQRNGQIRRTVAWTVVPGVSRGRRTPSSPRVKRGSVEVIAETRISPCFF